MRPLGDRQCVCGKWYWRNQAWLHTQCATNAATNEVTDATNTKESVAAIEDAPKQTSEARSIPKAGRSGDLTANRRKRADYNAYQSNYMRKRRAEANAKSR